MYKIPTIKSFYLESFSYLELDSCLLMTHILQCLMQASSSSQIQKLEVKRMKSTVGTQCCKLGSHSYIIEM